MVQNYAKWLLRRFFLLNPLLYADLQFFSWEKAKEEEEEKKNTWEEKKNFKAKSSLGIVLHQPLQLLMMTFSKATAIPTK